MSRVPPLRALVRLAVLLLVCLAVPASASAATTYTSTPANPTNQNNFPFAIQAGALFANTTVYCMVDKPLNDWATPGSAFSCGTTNAFSNATGILVGPLADGPHTVQIAASGDSAAQFTWTIDTAPPNTTFTGSQPSVNQGAPTSTIPIAFTSTEPATFQCSIDGAAATACTSGSLSYPTADGNHTVDVTATDTAGNADPTPAHVAYSVDTVAPVVTRTGGPSNPTASTAYAFTTGATDNVDGALTPQCSVDGGAYSAAACAAGTASEGDRSFDVRATDSHGNVGHAPTFSWVVDLTIPTISVTTPPVRSQDGADNVLPSYLYKSGFTPSYTCTDPLAGSPADASGIQTCSDDASGTDPLGIHTMTVSATDKVGHSATPVRRDYRVVPPKYGDWVNADHPLVYWRMDDPRGAADGGATDASGNHHDGDYKSNSGATSHVALQRDPAISCEQRFPSPHRAAGCEIANDPQGYSAFFPGRNAYVGANGIATTDSYSMEAWIDRAGSEDGGVMDHGSNNGALFIRNGRLVFHVQDTDIDTAAPAVGSWAFVSASFSATPGSTTGGTGRLYVNGVLKATGTTTKDTSGTPTFYVGLTNQPVANLWFHGFIDEAAYYGTALPTVAFHDRWAIGTYHESITPGWPADHTFADLNRPTIDITTPASRALYNPTSNKVAHAAWTCDDLEDGALTGGSCSATLDGTPIAPGAILDTTTPGTHSFTVTATDGSGLVYHHTHQYVVESFSDLVLGNDPFAPQDRPVGYWRFDEPDGASVAADASPNHHDGAYKNDTAHGPTGISGDGNTTRSFLGLGGYVAVNGVPAQTNGFTISAWVQPKDSGDMVIFDHGATGGGPAVYLLGGRITFRMPDPSATTLSAPFPYDGTHAPYASGFVHVVARWDGVYATLWVNGVRVDGPAESNTPPSGTPTLYIGYGNVGLSQPWFRGQIDEVSYYGVALRDSRIFDQWFADPPAPAASTGARSGGGSSSGGGSGGGGGGSSSGATTTATAATSPAPVAGPLAPAAVTSAPSIVASRPSAKKTTPAKKAAPKKKKQKAAAKKTSAAKKKKSKKHTRG